MTPSAMRRLARSIGRSAAAVAPWITPDDLEQEGQIAALEAARRWRTTGGSSRAVFVERRVRGAMLDALRRGAWPADSRRRRRDLEAARETLRRELGREPTVEDLARRLGLDEAQLMRTIGRIRAIESTSVLTADGNADWAPDWILPRPAASPHEEHELRETQSRIRAVVAALPCAERKVVGMYYYGGVTMREIGSVLGASESRVSQLHAAGLERLRRRLRRA